MAKEIIVQFWADMTAFFFKVVPWAFASLSAVVVKFTALYINGQKISKWKLFASSLLAVFTGVGAGHLCAGLGSNAPMYAAVASGLVGEKLILWIILNSNKLFSDLWGVLIGRIGGNKE